MLRLGYLFKTRLLAPLYASALVLALLIFARAGLGLWLEFLRRDASSWVTHTLQVQSEAERLLNAALNQETGLRGYLLTRETASLEPYKTGQQHFKATIARLTGLMQDNPEQLERLDQIVILYNRWQRQFAQPVISGFVPQSSSVLAGKLLFDPLRSQVDALLQREAQLLQQRNQQMARIDQAFRLFNLLAPIILLLALGCNLRLLHRRVEIPLYQLTAIAQAWEDGQMHVRFNAQSQDEIGRLAQILDQMASEVHHRQTQSNERNRQLDDLIASLSHDLRTPLLAIRATLRSMLNGAFGSVNETWQEVLQEYDETNENLLKLVEALLEVSRYEAGSKRFIYQPIDWEKLFAQTIRQEQIVSKNAVNFVVKIAASLPTTHGDRLEIGRVLQNLLSNAVRVSPSGGEITLEVALASSDRLQISVRDQGPGILPQEREHLFHRFVQGRGRRGGAGLGLYLCRQIVEAHNGTIGVESIINQGSTFWFTLPVYDQLQLAVVQQPMIGEE